MGMRMGIGIGTALITMLNETRKGFLLSWDYKFNTLTRVFMLCFIFVGIAFFMGNGKFNSEKLPGTLLGYLVWFYAVVPISDMSWNLMMEAQAGTLEQMYMSPAPFGVIMLGRALSSLCVATAMVVLVGTPLMLYLDIDIPMRWEGIPVLALTLIGLFGFGFVMGGATLVFKRIGTLSNMTQNALLFLNGSLLPVDQMPGWLALIAKTLPSTQGIFVLRNVVLKHQSLASAWTDGSLGLLIFHSTLYFMGGWMIFKWCERIAKQKGNLGQY